MSVAVEFDRVDLTYQGRAGQTQALADLNLSVKPGTFISILGPSGCGKSTMVKLACGLIPSSSGSVMVGGARVEGAQKNVGLAFQKPTLLPWKTVLQNVLVALPRGSAFKGDPLARAHDLIRLVRLDGFEKHYPHELSGGMQQRVALARALLLDPPLLLMDEPFAALDALTREEMALELLKLWERHENTVIFVTHSISEAVFLSDRIVLLSPRPGRVVEEVDVDLPRPRDLRTMGSPRFAELSDHLRHQLFAMSKPDGEKSL